MSKSKLVSAYPEIYFSIFEQVAAGKDYHSPDLEPKRAAALRLDFYGFRAALRAEKYSQSRLWDSFKILINTKQPAPLRIIGEQSEINMLLASTLEDVELADVTDIELEEADEMDEPDAGSVLGNFGFSAKPLE